MKIKRRLFAKVSLEEDIVATRALISNLVPNGLWEKCTRWEFASNIFRMVLVCYRVIKKVNVLK